MTWHLRAETTVDAPRSVVWAVLTDVEAYATWNPSLRVRGSLAVGDRPWALLVDRGLPTVPFRPEVRRNDPERELRWRTELPFGAVTADHTFRIESAAADDGVRFVQAERFAGPAADPVLRRLARPIRRTFERMNAALSARAETLAATDDAGDRRGRHDHDGDDTAGGAGRG